MILQNWRNSFGKEQENEIRVLVKNYYDCSHYKYCVIQKLLSETNTKPSWELKRYFFIYYLPIYDGFAKMAKLYQLPLCFVLKQKKKIK